MRNAHTIGKHEEKRPIGTPGSTSEDNKNGF
jgi:hypothetical protein